MFSNPMTTSAQYTLKHVAETIGFSESLVIKLATYFKLPRQYFAPTRPTNQKLQSPKLLLFDTQDLDTLWYIKHEIASGHTLAALKKSIDAHRAAEQQKATAQAPPRRKQNFSPVIAFKPLPSLLHLDHQVPNSAQGLESDPSTLVEYDQSDVLNRHLAHHTFDQYRRENHKSGTPPLKSLADKLQTLDEDLAPIRNRRQQARQRLNDLSLEPKLQAMDDVYQDKLPFTESFPTNDWISPEQQARMQRLQEDLLYRLI